MARPSKGVDHVDGLQGDARSKQRLKALLATIVGERTVQMACELLGIGPTHFDNLRRLVLQAALDALRPKRVGRPPKVSTRTEAEYRALERRNAELEHEVVLLRAQVEVARLSPAASKEVAKRRGRSRLPARTP